MNIDTAAFTRLLLDGNQNGAWNILKESHDGGTHPLEVMQELLTPSMAKIGLLWEEDEISVADEHLATTTCDYILSRYREYSLKQIPKTAKKAMFLCLEDELHHLGLKMVSILFEWHGYQTRLFGASLPLEYALEYAEEWKPDVVGLSFSLRKNSERLSHYIDEIEELDHSPQVIVGGRLVASYDFKNICSSNTQLFSSLSAANDWLLKENSYA
ncbi:cobalamin B12-binding domain-containing protein [Metabacillus sp. JX24]|uniref:cobalamin B12-binding domain-containing protein n=1 Tax=Metabacillus sp. JX24 TaxID=3240759 RepID=UPI00350FA6F2